MSKFPECNRRGEIISEERCKCFTNRILHEEEFIARLTTCQACPYRNMEDDPDMPPVGEKPQGPGAVKLAGNFLKAMTRYIQDKGRNVSQEEYKARLEVCNNCQFLEGNRCLHMKCGCFVTRKAKMRSQNCPIGRWAPPEE